MTDRAAHWDRVYDTHPTDRLSWYEPQPETSLRLLSRALPQHGAVVDVGAGASYLVDALVAAGWPDVTVLDVSTDALAVVRSRVGPAISYVVSDVLTWQPTRQYDGWHDRAVFHFLASADEQEQYVARARAAVRPGGAAVLGVFAADGPTQCSGLPTTRHDADALAAVFADGFRLEHSERDEHRTPAGAVQPFTWAILRRE